MRQQRIKYLAFLATVGAVVVLVSATAFAKSMSTEQAQRDLTRILSEVFHRAHSQVVLNEVVRPKYGSPRVGLPDEASEPEWEPSCKSDISAIPSEPAEYPFALLVVPETEISDASATFTAYAIFVGNLPLPAEVFEGADPDWLSAETGGYRSLKDDFTALTARSQITVEIQECDGFSYATLSGRPR